MLTLLCNEAAFYESSIEAQSAGLGEFSPDRSAIIGRNNWFFIYEGSNNYIQAYRSEISHDLSRCWAECIFARANYFSSVGVNFRQVIIPNKLSVMNEFYPDEFFSSECYIETITHSKLRKDSTLKNTIFLLDSCIGFDFKNAIWRKNDSHLTLFGNVYFAEIILENLGLVLPDSVPKILSKDTSISGDLSSKFTSNILEVYKSPSWNEGLLDQKRICKTSETLIAGFNGTYQSFVNSSPVFDFKILVFGNSFFEKNPSWGMSPIFIALFREFHFLWSPNVDKELVERIKPDFVICQTVERFLGRTPEF
jgi:hypothetical protein